MMNKNGVPYIVNHIPRATRKRRPGRVRKPQTLTIHSTGNPRSTAKNERAWLTNPSNTAEFTGWHVVIDDREAIEAIPLNEVAYHAGDGSGPGNSFSTGVEICESGNREKTLLNAAKVVAAILKEQGLTIADLRQHYDWSKKNCPSILRADNGQGWREFVSSVQPWMNQEEPSELVAALRVLVGEGIISSPDYWEKNAVKGKTVQGEYAAALIIKAAEKLRR